MCFNWMKVLILKISYYRFSVLSLEKVCKFKNIVVLRHYIICNEKQKYILKNKAVLNSNMFINTYYSRVLVWTPNSHYFLPRWGYLRCLNPFTLWDSKYIYGQPCVSGLNEYGGQSITADTHIICVFPQSTHQFSHLASYRTTDLINIDRPVINL